MTEGKMNQVLGAQQAFHKYFLKGELRQVLVQIMIPQEMLTRQLSYRTNGIGSP